MTLTPRIRKSPYFDATVRHGATAFMAYNNMYLPLGYDTPENEFWHIVNDVTLWDVAVQRIVEITGPDAFAGMDVDIREPDASALQIQGPKSRPLVIIGKDALARIASAGAGRLLAGVVVDGEPIRDTNQYRWPVRRGNTSVGVLTSLVYTPRLEKNIGYVIVETSSSALDTRLVVETPDGERTATVVRKPFVDATKDLPRRG